MKFNSFADKIKIMAEDGSDSWIQIKNCNDHTSLQDTLELDN